MKYGLYGVLAVLLVASMTGCGTVESGEVVTNYYAVCHIPEGEILDQCEVHSYEEIL